MLLKIFDAEFSCNKLSYFESYCLLTKMAAKTIKSCIRSLFEYSEDIQTPRSTLATLVSKILYATGTTQVYFAD